MTTNPTPPPFKGSGINFRSLQMCTSTLYIIFIYNFTFICDLEKKISIKVTSPFYTMTLLWFPLRFTSWNTPNSKQSHKDLINLSHHLTIFMMNTKRVSLSSYSTSQALMWKVKCNQISAFFLSKSQNKTLYLSWH